MSDQPIIAITLGDPCGIGPEVVAKALAVPEVRSACRILVIGSTATLQRELDMAGAGLRAEPVSSPETPTTDGTFAVLEPGSVADVAKLPPGSISAEAGRASVEWVLTAGRLALEGRVQAVATAPINKAAAHLAGYREIGHMELFQGLAHAPQVATMLMTTGLRVVHLTTHHSLREACEAVTRDQVLAKLRLTHAFFVEHGYPAVRIGVAALNPHGGEEGLLGHEEETEIGPAVDDARGDGIDATGPVPADSVFGKAIAGDYDVVLAMYHDQGHIAIKVHGWAESITLNLGLPFIRTSVDHGTAFDIAGRGVADATSMAIAILTAAGIARDGRLAPL
jgi:4-hydroxythreonine-4-phosphate dehydrogenase